MEQMNHTITSGYNNAEANHYTFLLMMGIPKVMIYAKNRLSELELSMQQNGGKQSEMADYYGGEYLFLCEFLERHAEKSLLALGKRMDSPLHFAGISGNDFPDIDFVPPTKPRWKN